MTMPDLRLTYEEQRCSLHTKLVTAQEWVKYSVFPGGDGEIVR